MATTYQTIFEAFMDKVTDYDLASYSESLQWDIMVALLDSACRRFNRICAQDLQDRDDNAGAFNIDLSYEELDIITEQMVVEWLKPILNDTDNLHNRINTKEYTSISPANMLLAIKESYAMARTNAKTLMVRYSYLNSNIEELKP